MKVEEVQYKTEKHTCTHNTYYICWHVTFYVGGSKGKLCYTAFLSCGMEKSIICTLSVQYTIICSTLTYSMYYIIKCAYTTPLSFQPPFTCHIMAKILPILYVSVKSIKIVICKLSKLPRTYIRATRSYSQVSHAYTTHTYHLKSK